MNGALALAAVLSAGACAFHTALTSRFIWPLRTATQLPAGVRRICELCFHAVGMVFAIIAAALAAASIGWLSGDAARLCGVLAGAVAVIASVSTMRAGLAPWRHPASYVFGTVAALAFVAG